MCVILNGYRDGATKIPEHNSVTFLFVGLDENRNLQKNGGCRRRIARTILDAAACITKLEN
jgi:hypothetical protein